MEHALPSLMHLFTFSHRACDAILQQRGIDIPNAYNPDKSDFEKDSVYIGLAVILAWEAGVIGTGVRAWLKPFPRAYDGIWRYGFLVFAGFGLIGLSAQLTGMAHYVDVCQRLLHGQNATAAIHQATAMGHGAIYLIAIGLLFLVPGIAIFARARDFILLTIQGDEERPRWMRTFWQSLGYTMDRPTATVYTYVLAAFLSFFGLVMLLGGIADLSSPP
ncbi:MAG TPA: hypothetical protein VFH72_13380 [Candidatus Baltobacteraceae bacterium]|nr:hypothetical protein [Candidatus Baltobacteraceae bacterium]